MPAKKAKDATDVQSAVATSAESVHNKLSNLAFVNGVLGSSAPPASELLEPSKLLLKCGGKDIVKKSSTRKNRYMLVFNALIAPAAAGKLGTLAQLDSKNPVLYMDFPNGRLKFLGTLVFPKNKYMFLKLGQSDSVLCEEVFENMVVFSDVWWIGTKADNPDEKKLPMPADLGAEQIHSTHDYEYGARRPTGKAGGKAGEDANAPNSQPATQEDADMAEVVASQRSSGRRAGPRKRYTEDSDASEEAEERSGDSAFERLPRSRRQEQDDGGDAEEEDLSDEAGTPPPPAASQRTRMPRSATKKTYIEIEDDNSSDPPAGSSGGSDAADDNKERGPAGSEDDASQPASGRRRSSKRKLAGDRCSGDEALEEPGPSQRPPLAKRGRGSTGGQAPTTKSTPTRKGKSAAAAAASPAVIVLDDTPTPQRPERGASRRAATKVRYKEEHASSEDLSAGEAGGSVDLETNEEGVPGPFKGRARPAGKQAQQRAKASQVGSQPGGSNKGRGKKKDTAEEIEEISVSSDSEPAASKPRRMISKKRKVTAADEEEDASFSEAEGGDSDDDYALSPSAKKGGRK